jgi:hypothetical protein
MHVHLTGQAGALVDAQARQVIITDRSEDINTMILCNRFSGKE